MWPSTRADALRRRGPLPTPIPAITVDGVVHYCVTNMPGAVPHTSTLALTNSTFPYLLRLANLGAREALRQDAGLAEGLNTWLGTLTHRGVSPRASSAPGRPRQTCLPDSGSD